MPTERQTNIILESEFEFRHSYLDEGPKNSYVSRKDKTGVRPKYSTYDRDQLTSPALFTGMWIFNTDTKRPNKYDGSRWVELPE